MEVSESFGSYKGYYGLPQGLKRCSPKGRDCIEASSTQNFNCSVACEGIHADVQLLEQNVIIAAEADKRKVNTKNIKHFSRMINEYRQFKKNLVPSFNFKAANKMQFGM